GGGEGRGGARAGAAPPRPAHRGGGRGGTAKVGEPQRAPATGDQPRRGPRITARKQRDVVSRSDELLGQVRYDPLGAAVQPRRDALVQRRDLCDPEPAVTVG